MDTADKKSKIDRLNKQIQSCRRCVLFKTRKNIVPGEGDINSPLMFIGEAPGANEDEQGKPFVGRAGEIFNRLLAAINLTRGQIFLCNVLKCRPPENRNPLPEEIAACAGSLDLQIKTVSPKIICTMGNFSTEFIFKKFDLPPAKISAVHGKIFTVETAAGMVKIIPLFHPAVATYNVNKYDELLKDIKIVGKLLGAKPIAGELVTK